MNSFARHCLRRSFVGRSFTSRGSRSIFATSSPIPELSRSPACSCRMASLSSRKIHTSSLAQKDRTHKPSDEAPSTDFSSLDVLGTVPPPSTSVDVCMYDGFGLNSGIKIEGGNGALLVNGEAFEWRPWETTGKMEITNAKGQFEVPKAAFAMFEVLWPRPDMLVIGTGKDIRPLSPQTRQHLADLGMRVEAIDTRNAAAQFNLLATERGVSEIAGALIPIGWQEGIGAK